jgi:NitT/TauT family transport system ATP-binding protein
MDVNFELKDRTPLASREAPEFRRYFNQVWKELDIHVS